MTPTSLPRSGCTNGISYHRTGEGPPVVLIHGVGLRAESWCRQIPALACDHTVFAVDMPGHGESARLGAGAPDLARFSGAIEGFIREAVGEPVIVVGHSMGALLALDMACRLPASCRGVAALTAVYRRTPDAAKRVAARARSMRGGDLHALASGPIGRWFGEPPVGAQRELAELCRTWLTEVDLEGYADAYDVFASEDGPSDAALASLPMPVLFLTGEGDPNSTPAMSRAMARLAPRGRVVIIEQARHMAQLTHPDETNSALRELVIRCGRRPAPPDGAEVGAGR